ncbi:ABC-2 type transport system permease protein [Bradyrhizobium lablabi]|uniref:ABC-2 type transport system permease protein n=1 Tax=Bradyrhizobium lablabi TaxID=722472 RepID=A0A1M6T3C6_9BRAD|nr:ABC transporter permease [Bradyrhizobium lablabi]SHK51485.1 ABC-2 type transport system permease protein [Bradyrhizobium lablabi]
MSGVLQVFRDEIRRIFTVKPAFSVLILGAAFYALFYPQPYLNEALRNVPIAVVDRDGTESSRDFARRVDATPDVAVTALLPDLASAEREVYARRVDGILVIPQYFERDLLHGRPSPVALYADASYFLIYQRVAGAVAAVARTVGTEVETARLIAIGVDPAIAVAASDPMPLTAVPIFNPEAGYATYVLPAAFVLILQQMLLMGVGLLGTLPGADPAEVGTRRRPLPAAIIAGKLLAYLALEAVILPIYLIVLPYLYGLPRLGGTLPILIFAVPFVLSVAGLGFVVAGIFRKPIRVALILAALGLPLFMVAGFSWPAEAIPPFIRLVSLLVPSTSAIDGFVKLSQLGAPLSAANPEFFTLWALAFFYNLFALLQVVRGGLPGPIVSGNTSPAS